MNINWTVAFNRLFDIINADENRQAPHYFSGVRFLRFLNKIEYSTPRDYMTYMALRKDKGLRTNREVYYKELLDSLSPDKKLEAYLAFIEELKQYDLPAINGLKKLFETQSGCKLPLSSASKIRVNDKSVC